MKIPQSVFDGHPAEYVQAAADADGTVMLYSAGDVVADSSGQWVPANEVEHAVDSGHNLSSQAPTDAPRPSDWWRHSLTQREFVMVEAPKWTPPAPHMQTVCPAPANKEIALPQFVFDNAPDWVQWAYYNPANRGVYWCANETKFGETQRLPGNPVQPLPVGTMYAVTRRWPTAQAVERAYPTPSVVTTKRIQLQLSQTDVVGLLREAINAQYPELAAIGDTWGFVCMGGIGSVPAISITCEVDQ